MFTGLIEDIGSILKMETRGKSVLITISCSPVLDDLKMGDSISVDGVCLTITQVMTQAFSVEASEETAMRTTLGNKKPKQKVNLERAIKLNNRLGGHLVSGHVDEIAKITSITPKGSYRKITFQIPQKITKYLVEKGSVAIDGISLTINEVKSDRFSVNVIPYTAYHTTLASKKIGDEVNIEVDILGKYVEKLIIKDYDKKMDVQFLSKHGFL